MKRRLRILLLFVASGVAFADQFAMIWPTDVTVSAADGSGEKIYTIRAELELVDGLVTVQELSVTIYGDSISIDKEVLARVVNPDFGNVMASHLYRSAVSIDIPFGDVGQCPRAEEAQVGMFLTIVRSVTAGGSKFSTSIFDPCGK